MNPNDTHREQLSALIDGALDADQSRFLLRRLQHDGELADSLSRWQMAGDVLRGQADAPVSAGFAEAIAARIADEPRPMVEGDGIALPSRAVSSAQAAPGTMVTRQARWRWFGGGAMAASLAIASVLALRPATSPVAPAVDYAATEAASPRLPDAAAANNASPITTRNDIASAAPITVALETATDRDVAGSNAASPRIKRASEPNRIPVRLARAAPNAGSVRTAERTPAIDMDTTRVASSGDVSASGVQAAATTTTSPFQPPAAKAWPRAVIPGAGSGTFNASLNAEGSYYPFEPRTVEPTREP